MSDEDSSGFENSAHPPFFRATYVDGRLSMVVRHQHFPDHSFPWAKPLLDYPDSKTVIADLTIVRKDGGLELIVEELARAGRPDFKMMLIRWAELLGYKRIWIGLDVLDLADEKLSWDTRVTTKCLGCHTEWRADQTGFWMRAREAGAFPNVCALCGQVLPVWEEDLGVTKARRASQRMPSRSD